MDEYWCLAAWVEPRKKDLDWNMLCSNPRAVDMVLEDPARIRAFGKSDFSRNPSPLAVDAMESMRDLICFETLSSNPSAGRLLLETARDPTLRVHLSRRYLSANPGAIEVLDEFPQLIEPLILAKNPHPRALKMFEEYISVHPSYEMNEDIWWRLCANPTAIHYFTGSAQNHTRIDWTEFCMNTHPFAMNLLRERPQNIMWPILSKNASAIDLLEERMTFEMSPNFFIDHTAWSPYWHPSENVISWMGLSQNTAAGHILQRYPCKVNWRLASANPAIFEPFDGTGAMALKNAAANED